MVVQQEDPDGVLFREGARLGHDDPLFGFSGGLWTTSWL
jgi:hypothetical protein